MQRSDGRAAQNDVAAGQGSPASPTQLFVAFTLLALQGFGGVIAVAQRVLVEHRQWLTREQFIEILSLAQVLPGPNVCNVALMTGDRFFGWRGAFAALSGMMVLPLIIVLGVAALYAQYATEPAVAGAFRGMGAVAAGLVVGTALKLASALGSNPMGVRVCWLAGATIFMAVALLRLPLVWVLLVLGSLAATFAWTRLRTRNAGDG
jgi:chromate transporter